MYTVKEVAARLGLTEHTIRYYTDKGLVPMVKRDQNNNRLFDDEAVNCLIGIRNLRATGMPLESVKAYIMLCMEGEDTAEERRQIIVRQRDIAKQQVEEAKTRLDYLEKKVALYEKIVNKQMPDNMNPSNWPTQSVG